MRSRKTREGAVDDPRIDGTRLIHLHLPGFMLQQEGAEPVGPICMTFEGAVVQEERSARDFLRGLRSLSKLNGWQRLDVVAVSQAPEFRSHLGRAVRAALDSANPSALASLLVEWPLAYLEWEVGNRLADGACDRSTAPVLREAGESMARKMKSSPKRATLALRDNVDLRLSEYRRIGESHDLKYVLAEVDSGFVTNERRSYRAYKEGSKAPRIAVSLVVCPAHANETGLHPAPRAR